MALSGKQTLRLTGTDVISQFGLQADLVMLVPTETRPQLSIMSGAGQVTVSFPTQTGLTCTLQFKNALNDPVWQDILPSINGDGSINSISQPATQSSRFYRPRVQ